MLTEGGEAIQLTHDLMNHFAPAWPPDARRLAFHARKGEMRAAFVVVVLS